MHFESMGKEVLREGQHFAYAASVEIARALALVLNLEFPDAVSDADVAFVEAALWGEVA